MDNESSRLNRTLKQRSLPRLASAPTIIETFEVRHALSANAAAAGLLEALDAFCSPATDSDLSQLALDTAAGHTLEPLQWEPAGTATDGSPTGEGLLAQAAAVRQRWNFSAADQTVAVIDSGIAWDHVALGDGFGAGYRVVGGWDFAENDADPYDDAPAGFHGTHVSGLIAGNSDQLVGVAPGADLVGLRVFDDMGRSSLDWIESALQWVYDNRNTFENPITTVNLSIGALLPETLSGDVQNQFADELQRLHDANIVVVAAAGNQFNSSQPDQLNYPASSEMVWAVGSTDVSGELSQFSQREEGILATLGRNVSSSIPDHVLGWDGGVDDYHAATGTSMASPQVAGASMLLREAMLAVGETPDPDSLLQVLQSTSATRVDLTTGMTYHDVDLFAAVETVMARAGGGDNGGGDNGGSDNGGGEPTDHLPPPLTTVDLGLVQWEATSIDAQTELRVTASQDGLLSVAFGDSANQVPLTIRDISGQVVWEGLPSGIGQIDLPATANQIFSITASTAAAPLELQLANILNLKEGHLTLATAADDPDVALNLSNGMDLSVGNFQYHFSEGQVASGLLDGGYRSDRLTIVGSSAVGKLILNPYTDSTFNEAGIDLVLRNFENISYDGGGGADRAYLYDTLGDDRLDARPGRALLEGVGFRFEIENVARSYVHATAGGQDLAMLYDSTGDERLAVRPQFVSLRGGDFFNLAYGFERVYAYANNGGHDTADLYDSAGNDRMSASSTNTLIAGPGYFVQAKQFDAITAYATAGGNDVATLYADDNANTRWIRTDNQITLKTPDGTDRVARGFEEIITYQGGVRIETQSLQWELSSLSQADSLSQASSFDHSEADTLGDDVANDQLLLPNQTQKSAAANWITLGKLTDSTPSASADRLAALLAAGDAQQRLALDICLAADESDL